MSSEQREIFAYLEKVVLATVADTVGLLALHEGRLVIGGILILGAVAYAALETFRLHRSSQDSLEKKVQEHDKLLQKLQSGRDIHFLH